MLYSQNKEKQIRTLKIVANPKMQDLPTGLPILVTLMSQSMNKLNNML